MNHISVGFSIHRPEIVPVTARIMEQHAVTEKARLAVADYIKTHYHKHVLL